MLDQVNSRELKLLSSSPSTTSDSSSQSCRVLAVEVPGIQGRPLALAPAGRRDLYLAVLLAFLSLLVYNANFRTIATGDSLPARFLPFAIWEEGSLHLDSVLEATRGGYPHSIIYWILTSRDGRTASTYPVVTPLLVTPLYLPAVLYLHQSGRSDQRLAVVGEIMEKVAASTVAALTVGLMFLLLRRRVAVQEALLVTGAYAFGTNHWMSSSQALWQHGATELFVTASLLLMSRQPRWGNVIAAGLATGLLPANRPANALLAVGFAAYALPWARRRAVAFFAAAAIPAALTLAYNLWMFGNVSGGYGIILAGSQFFSQPIPVGIVGLLFSPGKGLFTFAPFLLFLPLRFRVSSEDPRWRQLTLCLATGVVLQLLLYARSDWRGGFSYGPRFLTDVLPILIWMLAPIVAALRPLPKLLFVAACVFSVWVQAVGAFIYQGGSEPILNANFDNLWRLHNTPYVLELQGGFAPMRLLELMGVPKEKTYPGAWLDGGERRVIGSSR